MSRISPFMKSLFVLLFVTFAGVAAPPPELAEVARLRAAADSLHAAGRTDSAAVVAARAVELAEKSGDRTRIVGAHSSLGVFLRSLGRIDEALEHYEAALRTVTSAAFREHPDQEAVEEAASLYVNLAVLNLDMQNKAAAARYAAAAAEWCARSRDAALKSAVYGVAGSVMTGCGELGKARDYQEAAYRNAVAAGDRDAAFRAAAYAMLTADRLGRKAEAAAWRSKCQALLPEVQSAMTLLVYYQAECSICLKDGRHREALGYFDRILSLDGIDRLPFVRFDCYNNMHLSYAALGDYRQAYGALLKAHELRGELWENEKAESLRELTVKYESKEKELALAQSRSRLARTLMWLFAAAGLLLLVIVVFVVYAGRQRRRRLQRDVEFARLRADIGRQLTQQYVEGLENERRRMSAELHDGVCNDLLAIGMNLRGGQSAESTVALIDNCRESVRRISHELMPPEFTYATLDEVLRFLVARQADAHRGTIALTYASEADGAAWADLPDDVALEVYRVVQEAVGNAVRHSGAQTVGVTLTLTAGMLEAVVADDGTCGTGRRRGLGLDSMRRRAAAVGGSVTIGHGAEGGTTVRLNVKKPVGRPQQAKKSRKPVIG